ncbi:MAG: ABC transporter permease [Pyrinomonadaceae bacterium]|nr:ABC transporter permease [Pyrinomonadaceae bacterium]
MKLFREAIYPLIAVILAFAIGGVIVLIIGDNPFAAFWIFIESSFGSVKGITETLFYATPLIFTGLAVAVAFRCGLLNIGAEGQLYVAAFATAWVGIKFGGTIVNVFGKQEDWSWVSLPAILLIPMCIATAIIVGGLWGAIPGYLKARFGSHEVINTIMLNFIAIALVSYFTQYYYKVPGDPILQTAPIGEAAHIPQLNQFLPFIPETVALNVSFLIAILMCVLVYVFLWKTKWGYELRAVGQNPDAAEYGGISPKKQIVIAMAISGALAGMVAIGEVLGFRHNYYDGFSGSWGFFGIAVALLGRNHPFGVLIAAIFFAMIIRGGLFIDIDTKYITKDLVEVLQAVIILLVASLQKYTK